MKKTKSQAKPVRISDANYNKLKALGELVGTKFSLNESLSLVLEVAEKAYREEPLYAVKLYTDLAEARGAAIVDAVQRGDTPTWPLLVVTVGSDNGQ